jgi:GntR family phosphonate transport system transcriptional regulator
MSLPTLHRQGGVPLYRQISQLLEEEICSHYDAGDYLPAEHVLAARFTVNRHTLRRAVDELVAKGLLERQHGRGTRVLQTSLQYAIGANTRFTENLEALGLHPVSRVVRKLSLTASGGVARRLDLAEGAPVILIDTLREIEARPYCLISHFLPQEGLAAVFQDYQQGSLHQFLRDRFGLELQRTESLITAVLPMGDDASLLQMSQQQPVLRVKSINTDRHDGRPVEYSLARWRADLVQLHMLP